MARNVKQMRLTPELVARVTPYTGEYRAQAQVQPPDAVYDKFADDVLAKLPADGKLWVFAFGSLLWKPTPELGERRLGTIRGWHRAFTLGWDRAFRGNPDNPGLMLSLDRGGQCKGVALRFLGDDAASLRANLLSLLKREPPFPSRWVTVSTAEGPLRAIAFTNDRSGPAYIGGLSHAEIADALSKATGKFGSMAQYLHNTIGHLAEFGIHDSHLWAMQELIAERLERMADPPK